MAAKPRRTENDGLIAALIHHTVTIVSARHRVKGSLSGRWRSTAAPVAG